MLEHSCIFVTVLATAALGALSGASLSKLMSPDHLASVVQPVTENVENLGNVIVEGNSASQDTVWEGTMQCYLLSHAGYEDIAIYRTLPGE